MLNVVSKGMQTVKLCSDKNLPILNWGCQLTQVVLYNGRKTDAELQALNAALHLLSHWIILQSTTYSENNPYTSVYSAKS